MRTKCTSGGRARISKNPSSPPKSVTVTDGDDDVDVREIGSKDNVDNVTDEGLGHDKICVDVLDRNICMRCYEGGEILVCSEIGCPVVVHAKCIGCEPRFDDMGKYYCPYCWLKRTLVEVQVLRNKALTAKKDLADFLDGNVTASDELGEKCGEEKRRDSDDEVALAKNGSCLDDRSKQGNGCERTEPLQRVEDQQDEMEDVMADVDQHGKVIEDDTHEKAREADSDDPMHHGEENLSEHIDLTDKPRTKEKAGVRKITGAHKTTFIDGKKGVEPEHPRSSDENIDEGVPEDEAVASPSSSGHLGEQKDGLSPDIASVKKKPESTAAKADNKDARQGREESLQKESKMPSVSTSLSETNDSNSEAPLVKKRRIKHTAQKRPQRVNNAQGEDGCHEEEEVTSSETSRQVRKSSKKGHSKKLISPTKKRRRLPWTTEEENKLKEGVLKFSEENRNIPWRKILEYGFDVFDDTRTPVDLKDKWRTMTAGY